MVTFNAVYFVPEILALFAALYPAPYHFRTRNIGIMAMVFWMTSLNTVQIINCVVWSDNDDVKASVWGDISATIRVGYNYGLPFSHLILAKTLESYTSLRSKSPIYDRDVKRRHFYVDLFMAIAVPIIGTLVHLSQQDRRFYIVEKFGPMPATYCDGWAVFWMAIIPIAAACGVTIYTIVAVVNIWRRRRQMLSMIASDSSINKDQFFRLLFLSIMELGTCCIRAVFNMLSFLNGPQPLLHLGKPYHNLTIIVQVPWSKVTPTGAKVLNLQYYTVISCSYVFFLTFSTSQETRNLYGRLLRRIIPCIGKDRKGAIRMGSFDTELLRSNPTSSGGSGSGARSYESKTTFVGSQIDTKGSMSFNDMLNSATPLHTLDKSSSWEKTSPDIGSPAISRDGMEEARSFDDGASKAPSERVVEPESNCK